MLKHIQKKEKKKIALLVSCLEGSNTPVPPTTTLVTSGVKKPPLLRSLMSAEFGELRRWRGHVLSVGALGLRWGQNWGSSRTLVLVVGASTGGLLRRSGLVGLLLSASLLLPQQLLSFQEDTGVKAGCCQVAVTWSLRYGVAGILLGFLEFLCWCMHIVPGVLGGCVGILAWWPGHKDVKRSFSE